MTERLEIRKTYKLFIGGSFPRSESGHSYAVNSHDGGFLANAARASRKDIRDAVVAARKAWPKWAGLTAYNRGQILYRIAEIMESRRDDFIEELGRAEGSKDAPSQVDEAIDLWVWYAGWTDKVTQVTGGLNSVAGPYFNITAPEPTGVAGIIAPERPALLGLVERLAPALCAGDAVVLLASESHPLVSITLAECLATSDVPGGVVNILTGRKAELVPVLASHLDVDAIDIAGLDESMRADVERAAAENVKRIIGGGRPSPQQITAFMDFKTVWHPKGA